MNTCRKYSSNLNIIVINNNIDNTILLFLLIFFIININNTIIEINIIIDIKINKLLLIILLITNF